MAQETGYVLNPSYFIKSTLYITQITSLKQFKCNVCSKQYAVTSLTELFRALLISIPLTNLPQIPSLIIRPK